MMNTFTDPVTHLAFQSTSQPTIQSAMQLSTNTIVGHKTVKPSLVDSQSLSGLRDTLLPRVELTCLLPHLPKAKQAELQKAVEILLEATQSNHSSKPLMVILFGGYARGDWLQTPSYQSGFDLLALVKGEGIAKKLERKTSLHNRLSREVETPVHLLVEDIHLFNLRLGKGHYFFTEVVRDGVVLHNTDAFALRTGKSKYAMPEAPLSQAGCFPDRKALAQQDFDHWFAKANKYKEYADIAMSKGDSNEAAFFMHQSVECFYNTVLLVFGRYKPNTHDLRKLGCLAASIEPQFVRAFPQGLNEEKAMFDLLCSAYVDARYRPSFVITQQALLWLSGRIMRLKTLVEAFCSAKIVSYC